MSGPKNSRINSTKIEIEKALVHLEEAKRVLKRNEDETSQELLATLQSDINGLKTLIESCENALNSN